MVFLCNFVGFLFPTCWSSKRFSTIYVYCMTYFNFLFMLELVRIKGGHFFCYKFFFYCCYYILMVNRYLFLFRGSRYTTNTANHVFSMESSNWKTLCYSNKFVYEILFLRLCYFFICMQHFVKLFWWYLFISLFFCFCFKLLTNLIFHWYVYSLFWNVSFFLNSWFWKWINK